MEKRKEYLQDGILLCLLYALALWFLRDVRFGYTGDDQVYRTSIEAWGSWGNWIRAYYHGNSGRVLIHSLLILLLNGPLWVYKAVTAAVLTGTWVMIRKYSGIGTDHQLKQLLVAAGAVAMFFLIPPEIRHDSTKWMSGALNYLYPVCMLLICLYPFFLCIQGKPIGKGWKLLAAAAVPLCANMEQAGAVLAAMGIVCLCCCGLMKTPVRKRDRNYLLALWAVDLTVALIGYCAPGNALRREAEMGALAGYGMLTLGDTLVMGVQTVLRHFYSFRGLFLWAVPTGIAFVTFLWKKQWKNMLLALVCLVLTAGQNIIMRKAFDIEFVHPYNWAYVIWLVFTLALLFYTGYVISLCVPDRAQQVWYLFLYYGAVAAVVITCLSPTLYISAVRTCYIACILMAVISVKLGALFLRDQGAAKPSLCRGLSLGIGAAVTACVLGLFLLGVYRTETVELAHYQEAPGYPVENVQLQADRGTLTASVSVEPFAFVAENWCSGNLDTYDVDLQLGVLEEATGKIRLVKTCLNPIYPVMKTYPDDRVDITGYFADKLLLNEGQQYVIVYQTHDGSLYYRVLPEVLEKRK